MYEYAKDKATGKWFPTHRIDRREQLRVKVKSLAAEARIIRQEELKTFGSIRTALYLHRVLNVRRVARSSHLAYGFIKGRTLLEMEPTSRHSRGGHGPGVTPDWTEIRRLCAKYGPHGYNGPPVEESNGLVY